MIRREALADAEVNPTLSTKDARSRALCRSIATDNAVSSRLRVLRIVILGQRVSCLGSSACTLWLLFGWQLRQQLVHEFLAETQLTGMLLPNRPELEGIHDAHIQKPPRQARPRPHGLPTRGIGIVQLRQHVDRAGAIEVVADRFRAADGNFLTAISGYKAPTRPSDPSTLQG